VFPGSFDMNAARAMWNLKEEETTKLLGVLLRYSLLDYDEISSRYSLRDLLAECGLMNMEYGEEVPARIAHSVYYAEVLFNLNQLYLQGGENILLALRLYDAEWINIETGQRTSFL